MAKTTVAQLEARFNTLEADMGELVKAFKAMAQAQVAQAAQAQAQAPKQKPERSWVSKCPDYATAAQRVEYDKLVKRAATQRDAVKQALGTEAVSCFIPVSRTVDRMPHSIKWTATYN